MICPGERLRLPECPTVAQGRIVQPGPTRSGVRVPPYPGSHGRPIEELVGTDDVAVTRQECLHLVGEPGRSVPVVVVPVRNEVAGGMLAGDIPLAADGAAGGGANVADPIVGGYQVLDGLVAVVDDDELLKGV